MELPSEFRTEKTNFLENELKKFQLDELENLTNEDFRLLGMYIQTYNFINCFGCCPYSFCCVI